MAGTTARASGSLVAPPLVPRDGLSRSLAAAVAGRSRRGGRVLQRQPEKELTKDPVGFLGKHMVSLDHWDGMRLRTPAAPAIWQKFSEQFSRFPEHWFVLVPRAGGAKDTAYILTPAVERYAAAFPTDPLLAPIVNDPLLPAKRAEDEYLRAAYVPYLTGAPTNPDVDVGHIDVPTKRSQHAFTPDFVFTAAMNGCAFAVSGSATEDSFTAWHYQSPESTSNRPRASAFRMDKVPTDWFGDAEYFRGDLSTTESIFEATNVLWRAPGADNWQIVSQTMETNPQKMDDKRLVQTRTRPLRLSHGKEWANTQRVYKALAKRQQRELETWVKRSSAVFVEGSERVVFDSLRDAIGQQVAWEIEQLDAASDFPSLRAAGQRIKARRTGAPLLPMLAAHIADRADQRVSADSRKPPAKQDARMQTSLTSRSSNMTSLLNEWASTTWMDELVAEASVDWVYIDLDS
jgi:hypothetical protein